VPFKVLGVEEICPDGERCTFKRVPIVVLFIVSDRRS